MYRIELPAGTQARRRDDGIIEITRDSDQAVLRRIDDPADRVQTWTR